MKRLMLEHAFRFVDRVIFVVGVRNFRSQKAVEKIGGVFHHVIRPAAGLERVVYVLTTAAFEAGRSPA